MKTWEYSRRRLPNELYKISRTCCNPQATAHIEGRTQVVQTEWQSTHRCRQQVVLELEPALELEAAWGQRTENKEQRTENRE